MNKTEENLTSRRDFLKTTGQITAATALAGISLPHVHAQGSDAVKVALVGCGGRGSGAAVDALNNKQLPTKLVAMADVFESKLNGSYDALKRSNVAAQVDVPQDRKYLGFDAYKGAMDNLKAGDIAIFTTPLAFRWVHFKYAIEKGLNVFMEKPLTADGPSSRRMLELSEQAKKKNLKVGVGLMSRHSRAILEGVFHRVGIEVLVHVRAAVGGGFIMTSAKGLAFHRPIVLHPAEMIDVVDVEIGETSAAGPEERVEALDLPHQLAGLPRPLGGKGRAHRTVHAVSAHEHKIADFTV